jgi:aspartate carbamoyltransferase regulatory subunit
MYVTKKFVHQNQVFTKLFCLYCNLFQMEYDLGKREYYVTKRFVHQNQVFTKLFCLYCNLFQMEYDLGKRVY